MNPPIPPEVSDDIEIESDADRLFVYALKALLQQSDDHLSLSPEDFSEEYPPAELLFLGRDDPEEDPEPLIMQGRSEVKRRFQQFPKSVYKKLRSLMMDYEIGEEIPICTVGFDGSFTYGTIPLRPNQ